MDIISQEVTGRKSTLLEWSTAIFAIFWGVWWTKVSDIIFEKQGLLFLDTTWGIPLGTVTIIMALYVSFFTYIYIKWMWYLRRQSWSSSLLPIIKIYAPLVVTVIGFIAAYHSFFINELIPYHQYIYGTFLTCSWIIVTSLIVFQSDSWNV